MVRYLQVWSYHLSFRYQLDEINEGRSNLISDLRYGMILHLYHRR